MIRVLVVNYAILPTTQRIIVQMVSSPKPGATKNYDEDDDDDDVTFVRETNSSQLNLKPTAPTVEEYLGDRDATVPKISGRTARLNRPRRKTSSSHARNPRVVTIGEYTKARMGEQLQSDEDTYDDEEEQQRRHRIQIPKRRLNFDD